MQKLLQKCQTLFFFYRLDIFVKLFKTEENSNVATTLGNMASIYSDLGRLDKALELNDRVYGRKKFTLFNLIFFYI